MSYKLVCCTAIIGMVFILFWTDVVKMRTSENLNDVSIQSEKKTNISKTATPLQETDQNPCIVLPGYHYNGRLINKKTDNSSKGCNDKCLNDQGCGFYSYIPSNGGCFIYAYVDEKIIDKHAVSGNCIHKCEATTNTSTSDQRDNPKECFLENNVWYEGGGSKGGYGSQLDIRIPNQSAACSAKAPTPGACAKQCLSISECVSFNWRQRDNACHKFSSRGSRHDGSGNVGGAGHAAGNCSRKLKNNIIH